jgi:sugar lactone lactonase YvrE/TM2 domain-containing membrane protein YozV
LRKSPGAKQKLVLLAFVLLIAAVIAVIYQASAKAERLTGPGAMEVDAQGRLWLSINQVLYVIDPDGNIEREIDLSAAGITPPVTAMTPFRDGEMLLGSRASGDIHRMTAQGKVLGRLGTSDAPAWKPFGAFHLAYRPARRQIVITDTSNHRVLLLDEQGNLLRESQAPQPASQSYRFPNDVIVNNAGHILIVDTNNRRVLTLDGSLEAQATWSSVTFSAGYRYPVFIAQVPDGDYYLSIHDNRLDYAEVVRLNERGELQGAVAFDADVIPNGLAIHPGGVLVADTAAYAIWRIHDDDHDVSRFGGPRLQDILRETSEAKAFYESLVTACQVFLVILLLVMLVVAAGMQRRERKRSAQTALPMENAAMPPRQIWATFKQVILLLPILLLPMVLALSLIVQVFGVCTLDTAQWLKTLLGNVVVLLPLVGLAWLCRRGYRHGILRGRYHPMFVRRAHALLARHRPVLAKALAPGEQILGMEMGVLARLPALVVITNETLWVMTLSLFGTRVHRVQAIAPAAVAAAEVVEPSGFRGYLKYLGIPMWQLHFSEAGARRRYVIGLPDGYGANRLAEHLKQQAARSGTHADPAVRDAPCANCVVPGQNVTVAALLGLIFPGLGQFYAEEMYKGLVFLIGGAFLALTLLDPVIAYFYRTKDVSLYTTAVAVTMLLTLWAFALVDAVVTTRRNRVNRVGVFVLE